MPPPFRVFARVSLRLTVVGILLAAGPVCRAHGDDQIIIDALTEELAKAPEAELFIRRGELFRHHDEWAKADADFTAAGKLEPTLVLVDFFRARNFLESGAPENALPLVDRYLSHAPDEAEGRFLRGDILAALGQHDAGAAEYTEGIRRAANPRPEQYLRRAKFLAATPASDPDRVLAALDEGIARVGPVISLVDYGIALELERNRYEAALARIAAAMAHMPRREAWLVRQGDILVKCGRPAEAIASYRAALAAIEQLPARYRETVPMEKLVRDAQASLGQLTSTP